uniref:Annexin n=1 Tax=Salix viminalis TaxID=40686 RepID=A0A6N2JWL6_SALVM
MATLIAPDNHVPAEDAEALNRACKGWGTDEKAIISILGHRNAAQRKQIRLAYSELFQEDLVKRLESELTGDFEKAVYRWVLDPEDRDAVLANVAIRKSGDYHVIVEIACVLSSEELLVVRRAYHARYKHSLEEDLAAHTTGHSQSPDGFFMTILQVLVGLVTAFRYEGDEINTRLANSEADILHDAIKDKAFNHEEVIRILTTRSKAQLMATFNRYRDDHGSSITKDLLDEPADEFKTMLRTAIRCINDHKKYYEKILRNAIKKVGTDEDALTRVIVTRAEKDLNGIKEIYYKKNSVALDQAVAMDTSGDYKAFLLALLGKEE